MATRKSPKKDSGKGGNAAGEQHTHAHVHRAGPSPAPSPIRVDPQVIQRALNESVKALTSPEYQAQVTKLTQASISNSLQTIQKMSALSGRLSKLDSESMSSVVEGSINDLTRAFLQFNTDQLVLLQKLSARTLEILDNQSREK
ncbi:MAG: hypothetical protein ABSF83_04770 [Nitrososphaerales archaeon]|jgi:hypothetical protein